MDTGLIGIITAVGLNILITSFAAGKLHQKVGDLASRIASLEKKVDNTDTHLDTLSERIARVEGKLEKTG